MLKIAAAAVAAAALTFAGTQVAGGSSDPPGSTPERTVYSAVYALKHKNFGRFCSYLSQELRVNEFDCSTGYAGGWAQNLIFFGVDPFEQSIRVVPGYRVDVDEDTVSFIVKTSGFDDPFYRLTVERQPSGAWRITKFENGVNLPAEAERAAAGGDDR